MELLLLSPLRTFAFLLPSNSTQKEDPQNVDRITEHRHPLYLCGRLNVPSTKTTALAFLNSSELHRILRRGPNSSPPTLPCNASLSPFQVPTRTKRYQRAYGGGREGVPPLEVEVPLSSDTHFAELSHHWRCTRARPSVRPSSQSAVVLAAFFGFARLHFLSQFDLSFHKPTKSPSQALNSHSHALCSAEPTSVMIACPVDALACRAEQGAEQSREQRIGGPGRKGQKDGPPASTLRYSRERPEIHDLLT